ncbi:MAG TPA: sigma-70 family RNA polymerase sigma factor, partial [Gemmataceae bacterium]|nr:sigma-70 family RNA polymerase sigma factor [Gemmataceae bacterium]
RSGDEEAINDLLTAYWGRLERLARKMLGRFPDVRRVAETGDIVQGALVRLVRALGRLDVPSTRAFFGLAAEQMRRELVDLARHHFGPHGDGAHNAGSIHPEDDAVPGHEPADPAVPADLERWHAFHEAVARLPADMREVVGLAFYHSWTQPQIAELFGVSVRTIHRRWRSACLALNKELGGDFPPA